MQQRDNFEPQQLATDSGKDWQRGQLDDLYLSTNRHFLRNGNTDV